MTIKYDGKSDIANLLEQHPTVNNWAILVDPGIIENKNIISYSVDSSLLASFQIVISLP